MKNVHARWLHAAGIHDPGLRAAYEECRKLHAAFGRTYYLATLLLPPAKRPYVSSLYGFARYADEIVDNGDPQTRADTWPTKATSECVASGDSPGLLPATAAPLEAISTCVAPSSRLLTLPPACTPTRSPDAMISRASTRGSHSA